MNYCLVIIVELGVPTGPLLSSATVHFKFFSPSAGAAIYLDSLAGGVTKLFPARLLSPWLSDPSQAKVDAYVCVSVYSGKREYQEVPLGSTHLPPCPTSDLG